jgi:ribosome maturation factor RimP
MKSQTIDKIRAIAERVGASEGIEIVDVQLLGGGRARVLRIFIDKPEGVTHGDCESISHQVGTILDVEDTIPGERYTLEVSSPGLDRPLMKPKDYERFVGQKVRIQLREAIEQRKKFDGRLAAFDGQKVTLEMDKGKTMEVRLSDIEKANLKYEW